MAIKRLSVSLSEKLLDEVTELSKETGMTLSAVCTMAIKNYFTQQEGIKAMSNLSLLAKELEELKEIMKKNGEK